MTASPQYVKDLVAEYSTASGSRGQWETHWAEVAEHVLPSFSDLFTSQGTSTATPGAKKTRGLYDATGTIALPRFAAVMESMLTPRGSKWHRLAPLEVALNKDRATRLWMDELTDLLFRYRYAPAANFSGQNNQNFLMLGAFGTGTMFVDELEKQPGLRYKSVHLGDLFFFENHQGVVDKVIRRFMLSARQAGQKFGESKLPERIRTKIGTPAAEDKELYLHCVLPRADVAPGRADYAGMPWASYYILLSEQTLLREGGYNTFPYAIGRHTQIPGEVYGRSVAMEALPALKTLNEQKKTMLRVGHRALDPVLLAHDDGIVNSFSLRNGAVNGGAVTKDGRPLVHALPIGNLAAGDAMMEQERQTINDAFLITLFQILTENPQMTATEVLERVREKGVLLSPAMGRQQTEYLGPLIDRELDLLAMQGLLPPMPPALREAGGGYKVEYDSPLSRAQRAEEATGFLRWTEMGLKFAVETQDMSILDWVDIDSAMPELADMQAVPHRFVRAADAVAAIRDERSKQKEIDRSIAAAPAMAAVAKNIPSALPEA